MTGAGMKILIAEDDAETAARLSERLEVAGHRTFVADGGDVALDAVMSGDYDVAILDRMLPGRDGLAIAEAVRAAGLRTHILMVTALGSIADRVSGLEAGADDYLTKPFDFAELLARLRALLRRGAAVLPQTIAVGDVEIDTAGQYVLHDGRRIPLTTKEYALLEYLARHAGRVVGREELCAHVWDENHDPWSNAIEVCVARVRRKLESVGAQAQIQTRRGAGYAFADGETPLA